MDNEGAPCSALFENCHSTAAKIAVNAFFRCVLMIGINVNTFAQADENVLNETKRTQFHKF